MKSFTPLDIERRSFTGTRLGFFLLLAVVLGLSLYALFGIAFNLWLAGFLLLPNGLLIYLAVFAKDATLRKTSETLRQLGQTFG
ncbi:MULTISPECIES: hypothetical protein [Pseudomonas]|uniref:Uncharacterized protein n=2 Tax=Pseudomonadaceae TaxID=135621 RepID=A0A0D0JJM0_9PSED|nr:MULTISPECIES: hypothetical protein [Pseudomonas]KIQ06403.1 hypothetical protein RU08_01455 [Pseudomonas fulva]MCW2291382.1 hypothetical protein [Pseudomonas sp. BIGb0408]NYH74047.1 hypothetical protein [Pseudomonas flavescens]